MFHELLLLVCVLISTLPRHILSHHQLIHNLQDNGLYSYDVRMHPRYRPAMMAKEGDIALQEKARRRRKSKSSKASLSMDAHTASTIAAAAAEGN